MNKDERAYELLKFQSLAPIGDFDPSFPYFDVWKAGSDAALDQWDNKNPFDTSPELTAFRELERMGHYTQKDFYSPSKAKDGFYTDQLQGIKSGREPLSETARRAAKAREARGRNIPRRAMGFTPKGKGQ
jgi:hypothetical protein